MTTNVPEATVRRLLAMLGIAGLAWTLLHAALTTLALTTGPTVGSTAEALRVTTYSSPVLAVLSCCAAVLAFSGRTATRRPKLAGATLLTLALASATVAAASAVLVIQHTGPWALSVLATNSPLLVALFVCRRLYQSPQQNRPRAQSAAESP